MPITSITRVSTDALGAQGNGHSQDPDFSPDGSRVAFTSGASNLVAGDTNNHYDIFVKDLVTGAIERISTNYLGGQGAGYSYSPVFSPDGLKVAFVSGKLVAEDTNVVGDIYVKTLATGAIERISTYSGGNQFWNSGSYDPVFSPDGSKVAFSNAGTIYLKTLATGTLEEVASSPRIGSVTIPHGLKPPDFSPDGLKLVFESTSPLVPGDTNNQSDIFVKNFSTGAIERISSDAAGTQGNGHSYEPVFSPDGSRVAFESYASNLVPGDTNNAPDIFVKDLSTGAIERIWTSALNPDFSPDGTKVAFEHAGDIYVKTLATGETECVSIDADGTEGNDISYDPVFSPDGSQVAFWSYASNLVPGDTNGAADIFVVTLSRTFPGTPGDDNYCGANGGDRAAGFVNDSMTGQAGNDCFSPKGGLDTVFGGPGTDTLDYSAASVVFGAPPKGVNINLATGVSTDPWGNLDYTLELENAIGTEHGDHLVGNYYGSSVLTGLGGADSAIGGGGTLDLGNGDDKALCYGANNNVDLGDGADWASCHSGNSTVKGGAGNDTVYGWGGPFLLYGGADNDLLLSLSGGVGGDTIYGEGGNDSLFGSWGNDILVGGDGDDVADGSNGNDTIDLGSGNNFAFAGAGNDTVTGGADADVLMGQAGDDSLVALGGADNLLGGEGNDALSAGDGADNVLGEGGNDSLLGGGGNDVIDGGEGNDVLTGGDGDDVADGGDGNDTIDLGNGNNFGFAGAGIDTVIGNSGQDVLFGQGDNDSLSGGDALDNLLAGPGNDTLDGGGAGDNILGEGGDDSLLGGGGNDVLDGGAGIDQLFGQAGSDTFVHRTGEGSGNAATPDVIADFQGAGGGGFPEDDFLFLDVLAGGATFAPAGGGLAADVWKLTDGAVTEYIQITGVTSLVLGVDYGFF